MSRNTPAPGSELHKVWLVTQPHRGEIEVTAAELRDLLLQGLVEKPTKDQQAAAQAAGPQPTADVDTTKEN